MPQCRDPTRELQIDGRFEDPDAADSRPTNVWVFVRVMLLCRIICRTMHYMLRPMHQTLTFGACYV